MSEQEKKERSRDLWNTIIAGLIIALGTGLFIFYDSVSKDLSKQKEKIQNLEKLYYRDMEEIKDDLKWIKRNMDYRKRK